MRITKVRIFPTEKGNLLTQTLRSTVALQFKTFKSSADRVGISLLCQVKQEDGTYREIAFAINAQTRKMIEQEVIAEYTKLTGNPGRKAKH